MAIATTQKLELVSFKICPYVQRSVITLNHKKADYKITYIDLENPPAWFDQISPMGKVPVLKVGENTVLFESAVINEYLDETIGERLLAQDPLVRAYERAWIEYGSNLLMSNYSLSMETDRTQYEALVGEFFEDLGRLEDKLPAGAKYFSRGQLSLVDTAYAPLFMRIFLSPRLSEDPRWEKMPKVRAWGKHLMSLPAVKDSVVPEFNDLYVSYVRKSGTLIF